MRRALTVPRHDNGQGFSFPGQAVAVDRVGALQTCARAGVSVKRGPVP
jgi:hypothetical protein